MSRATMKPLCKPKFLKCGGIDCNLPAEVGKSVKTDGELLAEYSRKGRAEAFEELVGRHASMVHGVCRRVLGGHHDAEDAAQAAFLALARNAARLRGQASCASWLFATAGNMAKYHARSRANRRRREEEVAAMRRSAARAEEPAGRELAAHVDGALAALGARFRNVLVLRHLEGLSNAETAERLGVPENTAATWAHRGLDRLRRKLRGKGLAVSAPLLAEFFASQQVAPPAALVQSAGAIATQGAAAATALAVKIAAGFAKAHLVAKLWTVGLAAVCLAAVGGGSVAVYRALASHAPARPGLPRQISFSVEEPAGIARKGEPVSGGIPFPRGAFKKGQSFALFDDAGREIPCQVTPLVTGPDGTLRWALLDFRADIPASGIGKYRLEPGRPSAQPPAVISVVKKLGRLEVDTGVMSFAVDRTKPFALFDSVSVRGRPVVVGGAADYVQLHGRGSAADPAPWQGRKLTAGPPESLRVLYSGPLRVTLEVSGRFRDDPLGAGYTAWITAWAGSTRVRVKYKLRNSNPGQWCVIPIRSSTLRLKLAEPAGASDRTTGEGWIAAGGGPRVLVCDNLFGTDPSRGLTFRDGELVLEGTAAPAAGGQPVSRWLFDCSHHTSEYFFDFDAPWEPTALDALARASRGRLLPLAPADYYSACEALSIGRFGALADEISCYRKWGWSFESGQAPEAPPVPGAFKAHESNHMDSEGDSVEGLMLMYLRTGQRGWFDRGEAWARYHMDLQSWRTDGWRWKEGLLWYAKGPKKRKGWNFQWGDKRSANPREIGRHLRSKACHCHTYGTGLVDYYCLTGDRDALEAAVDNVECKAEEYERQRNLEPGRSTEGLAEMGFGRGFQVAARVLAVDPDNQVARRVCTLAARTLWLSPQLDERGFHPGGVGSYPTRLLDYPEFKAELARRGLELEIEGNYVRSVRDPKTGRSWRPKSFSESWPHTYIQNAADICAREFDDEDMRDYTIAFAQMSARFLLKKGRQVPYNRMAFDLLEPGEPFAPRWLVADPKPDTYYTRFYPDVCARGYRWTGEKHLLEAAREFWRRGACSAPGKLGTFATHRKSNHDYELHASKTLGQWARPRSDAKPPEPVTDLEVTVNGDKATVTFTAPADLGGGRVARYQVKCSALPIVPYDKWSYARDLGKKRNWWKAVNLKGEPAPKTPGARESFTVTGVPAKAKYFAVRSFDEHSNRSDISNLCEARR